MTEENLLRDLGDGPAGWRIRLATDIRKRNPGLEPEVLTRAVAHLIDRLILLRMLSDRGLEDDGLARLASGIGSAAGAGAGIPYDHGRGMFASLWQAYGFDAFARRDDLDGIAVGHPVLLALLHALSPPTSGGPSPILPPEIPAMLHERNLGKVIRTDGCTARIEYRPGRRKSMGVFYTPRFLVDFILEHTLGRRLAEIATLEELLGIRVCDPACGSGAFLLAAYDRLLDWAAAHGPLTSALRLEILASCIHGVDIDGEAIEIAKTCLTLRALEGSGVRGSDSRPPLPDGKARSRLGNNIRRGNFILGWEEARYSIVVGNPPWGAELKRDELDYLRRANRDIIVRMIDSFMFFVHQSARRLEEGGRWGMVLPDVFLYQQDNARLRRFLADRYAIDACLNLGKVFDRVARPASVVILRAGPPRGNRIQVGNCAGLRSSDKRIFLREARFGEVDQGEIREDPACVFDVSGNRRHGILERIRAVPHLSLGECLDGHSLQRGVSPDLKAAFVVDGAEAERRGLEEAHLRRVVTGGRQVKRFHIREADLRLIYCTRETDLEQAPNIRAHLERYMAEITCKEAAGGRHSPYALHRPREPGIFQKKAKLIGVVTEDEIVLALDTTGLFATDGLYVFGVKETVDIRYVMAILNSRLFVYLYRFLSQEGGRVMAQVKPTRLLGLPIRKIETAGERRLEAQLISHCQEMLEIAGKGRAPRVDAVRAGMDALVYALYGLGPLEIRQVEESVKMPA